MSTWKDDIDALMVECEVEDHAIGFLWDLPPSTAVSLAVTAARLETQRWEIERSEMLKRDDPRPVYQIYSRHKELLDRNTAPFCIFDIRAVAHLLSIFARLPADAAALASINVARWAVHRPSWQTQRKKRDEP